MTKLQITLAFLHGYQAALNGVDRIRALESYVKVIPKRKRKYFKKPSDAIPPSSS